MKRLKYWYKWEWPSLWWRIKNPRIVLLGLLAKGDLVMINYETNQPLGIETIYSTKQKPMRIYIHCCTNNTKN